jgi:putative endonuclease
MNRIKQPTVYILTNRPHGTLYIGVTSDLPQRIFQHKQHLVDGFSKRYGLDKLVYYELHEEMAEAIRREKRLKEWKRVWKIELIERMNPEWKDLYDDLL